MRAISMPSAMRRARYAIAPSLAISLCACVVADAPLRFDGEAAQGALIMGRVSPGSEVRFGRRTLRLTEEGRFIFGLGRDATPRMTLEVKSHDDSWRPHSFDVRPRDWPVQHIRGVPPRTVSPPAKELPRIAAEREAVRQARAGDSARLDFMQEICWPLKGPISGVFGSARSYNGGQQRKRPHQGTDVAAPEGAPVKAPLGGVVTLAARDMFFSGGTLIIDHGHGLHSSFLHLSKIEVEPGEEVKQGMKIAEVGSTGRATGPHLHWQLNWFETPVDIQPLTPPMESGCAASGDNAR